MPFIFLQSWAFLDSENSENFTPSKSNCYIMIAGMRTCLKLLNSKGQTALDVALIFSKEEAARLLERYWVYVR